MSGPFVCYRELCSSSSVENGIIFYNYGTNKKFLLIITKNSLSVYLIQGDESSSFLCKMLCEGIYGSAKDIKRVNHLQYPNEDCFLISFDEGKFVVGRYDSENNKIAVVEMINAEENASGDCAYIGCSRKGRSMCGGIGFSPFLAVDPSSQLACSILYGQSFLFLPFNSSNIIEDSFHCDLLVDTSAHANVLGNAVSSFGPIFDFCFLQGYEEPVLAVLHEPDELPIGHTAMVKHTRCLTVLAVNVSMKTVAVLWRQKRLPNDAHSVYPIIHDSKSTGTCSAVLVISMNAILVVTQSNSFGCGVNSLASTTVSKHIELSLLDHSNFNGNGGALSTKCGITLESSKWCQVFNNFSEIVSDKSNGFINFIGVLNDGLLLQVSLTFPTEAMWLDKPNWNVSLVLQTSILSPSIFISAPIVNLVNWGSKCSLSNYFWFIGTRLSDGLLLSAKSLDRTVVPVKHLVCFGINAKLESKRMDNDDISVRNELSTPLTKRSNSYSQGVSEKKRRLTLSNKKKANGQNVSGIDLFSELDKMEDNIALEERDLYGNAVFESADEPVKEGLSPIITVLDRIQCCGPILNGMFSSHDSTLDRIDKLVWESTDGPIEQTGSVPATAASFVADREAKDALFVGAGAGSDAGLYRISKGSRVAKIASRDFIGASSVVSVTDFDSVYMLLSMVPNKTKVFKSFNTDEKLNVKELTDESNCPFIMEDLTIFGGNITVEKELFLVQICSHAIRVLKAGQSGSAPEAIQDVIVADSMDVGGLGLKDSAIVFADICSDLLVLRTSCNWIYVLQYIPCDDCLSVVLRFEGDLGKQTNNFISNITAVSLFKGSISLDCKLEDCNKFSGKGKNLKAREGSISSEEQKLYESCLPSESVLNLCVSPTSVASVSSVDQSLSNALLTTDDLLSAVLDDKVVCGMSSKCDDVFVEANHTETEDYSTYRLPKQVNFFESINSFTKCDSEQIYLCIADDMGSLFIIDAVNSIVLFSSKDICCGASVCKNNYVENKIPMLPQYVVNCKLVKFPLPCAENKGIMCLAVTISNGDTIVYYQNEISLTEPRWIKLDHSVVSRKRRKGATSAGGLLRRVSSDGSSGLNSPAVDSKEFESKRNDHWSKQLPFVVVDSWNDKKGLIIGNSSHPSILSLDDNFFPVLCALSFPELPFSNSNVTSSNGMFKICSLGGLQKSTIHSAILSFWVEEEIVSNWPNLVTRQRGNLGIYRDVPNLGNSVDLSFRKLFTNRSVSFVNELTGNIPQNTVNITGPALIPSALTVELDKFERELLRKKTYVMIVTDFVKKAFLPKVLLPDEVEQDKANYERFFDITSSFSNLPDIENIAPPIIQRRNCMVMVQDGQVVDTYELPDGEHVCGVEVSYLTVMKVIPAVTVPSPYPNMPPVIITPASTQKIKKTFIVLSTNISDKHGEDTQGEGRLLLFGLDYARFGGDSKTKAEVSKSKEDFLGSICVKSSLLWAGPGPSTVVKQFTPPSIIVPNQTCDYILGTVGPILYVYRINAAGNELEQVGFYYSQHYIVSVAVHLNYVVLADACGTIQLISWDENEYLFTLLAKDVYKSNALCVDFLQTDSSKTLTILASDSEGNVQLFRYNIITGAPGLRLTPVADIYLGTNVISTLSHPLLLPSSSVSLSKSRSIIRGTSHGPDAPLTFEFGSRMEKKMSQKSVAFVGTNSGSLGCFIPVDEKIFRRLSLLQQLICMAVPTVCNLNAKEFRKVHLLNYYRNSLVQKKSNILDGTLLIKYLSLDYELQNELALAMGTSADLIVENIRDLDTMTNFF